MVFLHGHSRTRLGLQGAKLNCLCRSYNISQCCASLRFLFAVPLLIILVCDKERSGLGEP